MDTNIQKLIRELNVPITSTQILESVILCHLQPRCSYHFFENTTNKIFRIFYNIYYKTVFLSQRKILQLISSVKNYLPFFVIEVYKIPCEWSTMKRLISHSITQTNIRDILSIVTMKRQHQLSINIGLDITQTSRMQELLLKLFSPQKKRSRGNSSSS